jgi:hypothetical protein
MVAQCSSGVLRETCGDAGASSTVHVLGQKALSAGRHLKSRSSREA